MRVFHCAAALGLCRAAITPANSKIKPGDAVLKSKNKQFNGLGMGTGFVLQQQQQQQPEEHQHLMRTPRAENISQLLMFKRFLSSD